MYHLRLHGSIEEKNYLRTWQTDLRKKKKRQAKLLQMLFRRPSFLSPNMKINDERRTKIITSQTLAFRFGFSLCHDGCGFCLTQSSGKKLRLVTTMNVGDCWAASAHLAYRCSMAQGGWGSHPWGEPLLPAPSHKLFEALHFQSSGWGHF